MLRITVGGGAMAEGGLHFVLFIIILGGAEFVRVGVVCPQV